LLIMKIFYPIFMLLLAVSFLEAQDRFKVSPSPCKLDFDIPDPDGITDHFCEAKMTNLTSQTLHMLWTREDLQLPQDWIGYICDNNYCYAPFAKKCPEDNPNNIEPNKYGILDVHVNTNDVPGEAHIVLYVFEKEDTTKKIKVDFLFNKITANREVRNIGIKIYPNPAQNTFTVEYNSGVNKIELISILGKKVAEYKTSPSKSYDISNLDAGLYFLRLIGPQDQIIKTIRLQKKSLRP
jgi:hypothetical protein